MLWEHDGDMHHAWEDDDFTAEAAAAAQRAEPGPDHVADMLNNVLGRCDLPNKATRTV